MLAEASSDDDLAASRLYLQQQCAYGRDDFRAMVEARPSGSPA
jgi:putative transposase